MASHIVRDCIKSGASVLVDDFFLDPWNKVKARKSKAEKVLVAPIPLFMNFIAFAELPMLIPLIAATTVYGIIYEEKKKYQAEAKKEYLQDLSDDNEDCVSAQYRHRL